MGSKLITGILVHNICCITSRRATHTISGSRIYTRDSGPDLVDLLEEKLNTNLPTQTSSEISIYRIPDRLRSVEPKAYEPSIVSIGPFHHGAPHLHAMECTKWSFFHRLFDPNRPNLKTLVAALKQLEHKARGCYAEEIKISSNKFNSMMLIDSCFVVELLRETRDIESSKKSTLIKRWMLPVLQRDLIMLENQLPLFVLNKVYELTSSVTCFKDKPDVGLKELALQFFQTMMYTDLDAPINVGFRTEGEGGRHFLDLFRASICPTQVVSQEKFPVKEPNMFRSITELKESGVKLKKAQNCQPLDVRFEIKNGVLNISPVSMDDYRFTLFRNMVALEQCHCHFACKPYVTAYIFFLDRLINSAEDIELLHYAGVMQHSLGGNKHAARLVNKLCNEVAGAVDDSYLHNVLWKINCYCNDGWNQKRAKLKHECFYNVWVSLSTIAAVVLIYLTILQTVSGLGDRDARDHIIGSGFWKSFLEVFVIPFDGVTNSSMGVKDKIALADEQVAKIDKYIQWFFSSSVSEDNKPFFFMSC